MPVSSSPFLHARAADSDWHVAVADCLRQVQTQIAARAARQHEIEPPTLGWCYFSDHFAPVAESILGELQHGLPGISWVGTTGIGVAASGIEYFDEPALVLMVAPVRREAFRLFSGRQPLPARSSAFLAHTALVHAEGSTPDVQELLRDLSEHTNTGYLFGGLCSARNRSLHIADGVFTGGLSGVLFSSEVGLISRVTQGCQPIGPSRAVTKAEANFVLKLDGKPALDCLLQDLGFDDDAPSEVLSEALSSTLVGLRGGSEDLPHGQGSFGAETLVRHLVGVDFKHRVLAIAEQIAPGMQLAFCKRDRDAARSDILRITAEIRDDLDSGRSGQLAGALYVSCSGRSGPHFGGRSAELQIVREGLGDVPLVGFFAGGEIARDHLYGYTGVLTVFTSGA